VRQYLDLVRRILDEGEQRADRTGHGTLSLFGEQLKFDLEEGFPATTAKRLGFFQVAAELACFLRGHDNLEEFRQMGCNIWDKNAEAGYWLKNPLRRGDGDLGRIYGVQWRRWRGRTSHDEPVDQLRGVINTLRRDPWTRRALVTAWNAAEINEVCLPPCHVMFQFSVRRDLRLYCAVTMRSVDTFIGMPFDVASYALLTHLVAKELGIRVGVLTMWFGDTHVYLNHLEQARTMLARELLPLPVLELDPAAFVDCFAPAMARLVGYHSHPFIAAEMNP
jgi:thymidylate synthase